MIDKDYKQKLSDEINATLKADFLRRGFKERNWDDGDYTKLNGWELNRVYLEIKEKPTAKESLKDSFYKVVKGIMAQEMVISNIGVQEKFEVFALHLETIMVQPRIKNQFKLALSKFKKETGTETDHHFIAIARWIDDQPKNY